MTARTRLVPKLRLMRLATSLALVALGLASSVAKADTQACVAAHASGQREVKAGHLKQAVVLYTTCGSDASCPEQLRSECTELLEAARRQVPSVVFSVADKNGTDTSAVKVYANDVLLRDGLDGRAVELDPGNYHLRFELADGDVVKRDVQIRESEKNRAIDVRAESAPKAPLLPPPTVALAPVSSHPRASGPPVAAWIATGVAVVGFGTFGTFALLGKKDRDKLDECAPTCPDSEQQRRDRLKTKYLVADVGLGVGAAFAVLAGVLFLTSGGKAHETASAHHWDVASDATGARLLWRGAF